MGYGYNLISAYCTKCFWDFGNYSAQAEETSVSINLNELPSAVGTIQGILNQIQTAFPFLGIAFRFHSPSNALLSMAHGKKVAIMDIIFPTRIDPNKPKASLAALQSISQAMVRKNLKVLII